MANDNTEASPLGRSWKLWGGVLGLILVAIIISFFIPPGKEVPAESQPSHPQATFDDQSPSANASKDESCPNLSADMAMPTKAPETKWDRHPVGTVVPTSKDHGPALKDGDFWGCYSRTPTGALFAAIGLLSDASAGEGAATTDSPGRDAFITQHALKDGAEMPTIEGFRIIMADDDNAVIEYSMKSSEATAYVQVKLTWSEDAHDWRIDLESQDEPVTSGQITDQSSYIAWR